MSAATAPTCVGRLVEKHFFSKDLWEKESRNGNVKTSRATCPAETPLPQVTSSFLASCLIQPEVARAKGFKLGLVNQQEIFGQLSLGVNWGHGALDRAEHWEKLARLALGMELSWRRSGPPLCLRRKRTVFTPMWQWPHYKWQCVAAPWEMASSGSSLHPPVHLCLLLVLRGKYLAKK